MNNYSEISSPPNLVTLVTKTIRLENVSDPKIEAIKKIGAYEDKESERKAWLINYANENELANKLNELNKLNFLFVGEPAGWPPAAVFDYLREKDLLKGGFKEITWRGSDDWLVTEK